MNRRGRWLAPGTGALTVIILMACTGASGADEIRAARTEELQSGATRPVIEHITPRRDSVGGLPEKFEWTAVPKADHYALGIWTEFDQLIFSQENIPSNSLVWPRENKLDMGTYFWSVTALSQGRPIAESGLAAFVINR
jgi:hypothetical protein